MNIHNRSFFSFCIFSVVTILFFLLNHLIGINIDDLRYEWKQLDDGYHPIESFSDIIEGQYWLYHKLHGRVVIHTFIQLFCGLWKSKILYNCLAALMFSALIIILGRICFYNKPTKSLIVPSVALMYLFWLFNSDPISLYLSISFGFNYLFPMLACLLYIYLFLYGKLNNRIKQVSFLIIAFLSGASQELFAVGAGTIVFLQALIYHKRTTHVQWGSILIFFIGLAFLLFAPGNFARMSYVTTDTKSHFSIFSRWISSYQLFIFFLVLGLLFWKQRNSLINFAKENYPFIMGWICSIAFLCVTGIHVYSRMMLGVELWGFIIIFRYISFIKLDNLFFKASTFLSFIFIIFLCVICYWQNVASVSARNLEKQGKDINRTEVRFPFEDPEIPSYLGKYINICQPLPELLPFYTLRYKKPVYFYYKKHLDCINDPLSKVPGNNPFYKCGDELLTTEQLPLVVDLEVSFGEQLPGIKNHIRKTLAKKNDSTIILEKEVVPIKISNDTNIYRLMLPQHDFCYKIKSVDMFISNKKTNTVWQMLW